MRVALSYCQKCKQKKRLKTAEKTYKIAVF